MDKFNIDIDQAISIGVKLNAFRDDCKAFLDKGISNMESVEMQGALKTKRDNAMEVIRSKSKIIEQDLEETNDVLNKIIGAVEGYDSQTVMQKIQDAAEQAKSAGTLSASTPKFV